MKKNFVWTPPGLGIEKTREFLSLKEGIPKSANSAVYRWIVGNSAGRDLIKVDFLVDFQTALRQDLGIAPVRYSQAQDVIEFLGELDQTTLAYLVDFMLSKFNVGYRADRVNAMENILSSAGAGWTVGARGDHYGLIESLPTGVVQTAEDVVSLNSEAGALLSSAWDGAFGVNKRPSHAYYDAVRAVEVLSTALFSPNDSQATLGKDINVLRNAPEKWSFVLEGSPKVSTSPVEQVLSMMQLLWHSHEDRHGREDYKDVSVAQAQAAVFLASTLVGIFSQGMLERRES